MSVDSTVEIGYVSSITGCLPANIIIFSVIKSTNRTSHSANKFLTCSMVTPVDVSLTGGVTSDASAEVEVKSIFLILVTLPRRSTLMLASAVFRSSSSRFFLHSSSNWRISSGRCSSVVGMMFSVSTCDVGS